MDAFLLNGSTPSARIDPASGGTRATLLFNPQPRQRFVFPTHNDKHGGGERKKGPPLGGGEASGYKQFRSSKRERRIICVETLQRPKSYCSGGLQRYSAGGLD